MTIANKIQIEKFTTDSRYPTAVNAAAVSATRGKLPCYAINGKRAVVKWVSVGSSAVIARGLAKEWLARFGADIDQVEVAC